MSGAVWLVSYMMLWAAVAVLLVMVLALLRQIGVLHTRLDAVAAGVGGPGAASVDVEEGPAVGADAPMAGRLGFDRAPMTVLAFVAGGCELSAALAPALRVVDKQYGEAVRVVELELAARTMSAFEAFNVQATPFVVCVDRDGVVRSRGRARSLGQLEDLVASAGAAALAARKARSAASAGSTPAPRVDAPVVDLTSSPADAPPAHPAPVEPAPVEPADAAAADVRPAHAEKAEKPKAGASA
jgi:hypothetical protein